MLLSVPDLAFGFTFERNAIEAVNETFPDLVFQKDTFCQIDYADQRVARFW
jgi:hypothetical protein